MNAIQMTPEVVQAVNELCAADNLNARIVHLQDAEDAIQKVAHEELTGRLDYLFRFAYELKLLRDQFEKLEKILGYEPDRD